MVGVGGEGEGGCGRWGGGGEGGGRAPLRQELTGAVHTHIHTNRHQPFLACPPPPPPAARPRPPQVEYSVSREQADGPLGLDIGQRIYLYVKPEAMMGFEPSEVDSAPIL